MNLLVKNSIASSMDSSLLTKNFNISPMEMNTNNNNPADNLSQSLPPISTVTQLSSEPSVFSGHSENTDVEEAAFKSSVLLPAFADSMNFTAVRENVMLSSSDLDNVHVKHQPVIYSDFDSEAGKYLTPVDDEDGGDDHRQLLNFERLAPTINQSASQDFGSVLQPALNNSTTCAYVQNCNQPIMMPPMMVNRNFMAVLRDKQR